MRPASLLLSSASASMRLQPCRSVTWMVSFPVFLSLMLPWPGVPPAASALPWADAYRPSWLMLRRLFWTFRGRARGVRPAAAPSWPP